MSSKKTIDSVKEIVSNLLKIGGSDKIFDDLFTIEIMEYKESWEDSLCDNIDYCEECEKDCEDQYILCDFKKEKFPFEYWADENLYDSFIKVTAKDEKNEDTAKLLSKLHTIFDYEGSSNY